MHIDFINKTRKRIGVVRLRRYVGIAEKLLYKRLKTYCPKGVPVGDLGLSVFFVGDRAIQSLNRDFRGKDNPTDVITFSFVEDRDFSPAISGEVFPAGEIFLSLGVIARQAKEKKLSFENELIYMLIHGFLHTFGYDHQNDKDEREMECASYKILGEIYPRKVEFGF